MAVEEGAGLTLNYVAHNTIVRQLDEPRCVYVTGPLAHRAIFKARLWFIAELGTPSGEPELYQSRAIVGLWLRSVDGPVQPGPAYVDIKGLREGF